MKNEVLNKLKKDTDIIICGPDSSKEDHLRLYAFGGLIGKVPIKNQSTYLFPNKNYDKYVEGKDYTILNDAFSKEQQLVRKNQKAKFREECYGNDDFIASIKAAAKKRFLPKSKDESMAADEALKERAIQTKIVRNYMYNHSNEYIACDIEYTIKLKIYIETIKAYYGITLNKGNPKIDIIMMNLDKNPKEILLVELKCNKKACESIDSGLKVHCFDMLAAIDNTFLKEDVLKRFLILIDEGLLSYDKGIDKIKSLCASDFVTKCCFLFVKGDGLDNKEVVQKICEKELTSNIRNSNDFTYKLNEKDKKNINFLYADSFEDIDFNKMQSWNDFFESQQ